MELYHLQPPLDSAMFGLDDPADDWLAAFPGQAGSPSVPVPGSEPRARGSPELPRPQPHQLHSAPVPILRPASHHHHAASTTHYGGGSYAGPEAGGYVDSVESSQSLLGGSFVDAEGGLYHKSGAPYSRGGGGGAPGLPRHASAPSFQGYLHQRQQQQQYPQQYQQAQHHQQQHAAQQRYLWTQHAEEQPTPELMIPLSAFSEQHHHQHHHHHQHAPQQQQQAHSWGGGPGGGPGGMVSSASAPLFPSTLGGGGGGGGWDSMVPNQAYVLPQHGGVFLPFNHPALSMLERSGELGPGTGGGGHAAAAAAMVKVGSCPMPTLLESACSEELTEVRGAGPRRLGAFFLLM